MSETVTEITARIRRHLDEPMTGDNVTAEDFAKRARARSLCVPDAELGLLLDALAARERELAEARAQVGRWVQAAMAASLPAEFGMEFDSTNPEMWAMVHRAAVERALNERDAARADLAAVEAVAEWQLRGDVHEFTCGTDSRHRPLVPSGRGLRCLDCQWTQPMPDFVKALLAREADDATR